MDLKDTALYKKAINTVKEHNMLNSGDRVVLGLSGGADSVALLIFMTLIREEYNLKLFACHVNHCIRGEESDGDEAFSRSIAEKYGVPFFVHRFNAVEDSKNAGMGVEEYSRNERYAFFDRVAEGGKIATAHTLSDAMETVIFNLARGTGPSGVTGIPYKRENIIRPVRDVLRTEVEDFLAAAGEKFCTDSTNLTDDYARNFIRHNIIPNILKLNSSAADNINKFAKSVKEQQEYIEEAANSLKAGAEKGKDSYKLEILQKAHKVVLKEFIAESLKNEGVSLSARTVDLILNIIAKGSGAVEVKKGIYYKIKGGLLLIEHEKPEILPFKVKTDLPSVGKTKEFIINNEKKLRITALLTNEKQINGKINNKDLKNIVSCDKIKTSFLVRSPKVGDTIYKQGRHQEIMRYYRLGAKGMSNGDISRMLICEDDGEVIWAERIGSSELPRDDENMAYYFFDVVEENKR